ncbi:unnamed protein product [Peniophora sp. CBMAI 1063]|nr:unnamed protein product [Peniophora sp. CBMAI 1063]
MSFGDISCALSRKPGKARVDVSTDDRNRFELMNDMTPKPGAYLVIGLMVHNRTKAPMLILGSDIIAVVKASRENDFARGTQGKELYLPSKQLDGTPTVAQALSFAELVALNGKTERQPDEEGVPPAADETSREARSAALIDEDACAVMLKPTEHAVLEIQFRLGGTKDISHQFHAWSLLDHFVVPCLVPYSPMLSGPFRGRSRCPTDPAGQDAVVNVSAPIVQSDVDAWFADFRLHGEQAHVKSHYGESRGKKHAIADDFESALLQMMGN